MHDDDDTTTTCLQESSSTILFGRRHRHHRHQRSYSSQWHTIENFSCSMKIDLLSFVSECFLPIRFRPKWMINIQRFRNISLRFVVQYWLNAVSVERMKEWAKEG